MKRSDLSKVSSNQNYRGAFWGMDKTYIDSPSSNTYSNMLKKCVGRGHKNAKYLFNPRITEEWKEGGTLIVGINHWCTQKGCKFYEDCVLNSNSKEYNKQCEWAESEVDDTTQYDLRYTTYEAFNCYFAGFKGYESFKEFLLYITGTQDCMEPEEQKRCWNQLAFYNYIQHFTKMSLTHTSMYGVEEALSKKKEEDFAAFVDVLHDLKPKLVIVWHKDIKNLLLQKIDNGEMPNGRSLQLVDDLGIPTKSMFRFVYQEKIQHKQEISIDQFIKTFEQEYERIEGFSTEQVVLRLLRWSMFKTEEDLKLLTELSVLAEDLKNMLEAVECVAWNSEVLSHLVRRIQEQLGITRILEKIPYEILHYKKDTIVYSNVLLPSRGYQVRPLVGLYPQDCSHYSLKKYEEKSLLAFTGLSFDGLRSKTYIDTNILAQGFIIYIDEKHPVSDAIFKHLFEGKVVKDGISMIIMRSSEENDNRYLRILKESNRLHTIKPIATGNAEDYLFIKLYNEPKENRIVQIMDKERRRICNNQLKSLIPVSQNSIDYGDLTRTEKKALVRQIGDIIRGKIKLENHIREKLEISIANACICGLLSIVDNKTIEYQEEFGSKLCYRLFCYKIYKILNERTTRVNDINRLFNLPNVANITDKKIEEELKAKGKDDKIKLVELCINSSNMADFERKFKQISKNKILIN